MAARLVTSVRRATPEEACYHTGSDSSFVLLLTSNLDDAVGAVAPLAFTPEAMVQLVRALCAFFGARMVRAATAD